MNFILCLFSSVLCFLLNVSFSLQTYRDIRYTLLYKWKAADFDYPNQTARNNAIKQGDYIPENVLMLDSDCYPPTDRLFVTTPRFGIRSGIPATFSEVNKKNGTLKPFPSWSDNNAKTCQSLISVVRTCIDKCGRLWLADSGGRTVTGEQCPAKLQIYDLNRGDKKILQYEFPNYVVPDRSVLVNIIVESYKSDCSDAVAYIADSGAFGLILFNYTQRSSYRIENILFHPYPDAAYITTTGVTNTFMDGIFGLALSMYLDDIDIGPWYENKRKLYFHSLPSVRESWVSVNYLKNQSMAYDPTTARAEFVLSPGRRPGQSTLEVMTEDGILIYPIIPLNALACWNSRTPFILKNQHILLRDDENFQFITGLKMKNNKLLIFSSRFQNYVTGKNTTDFNYRMMTIDNVKNLLKNTPCTSYC